MGQTFLLELFLFWWRGTHPPFPHKFENKGVEFTESGQTVRIGRNMFVVRSYEALEFSRHPAALWRCSFLLILTEICIFPGGCC